MTLGRDPLRDLERDLDRWIASGWVAPRHREAILADAAAHHGPARRFDMAGVLALLGVLLIGAGAVAFVAANWNEMARGLRLAVLLGSMVAAFAGGWWFAGPGGRPAVGQSLILLAVLLFGADIMLIAQTYHIQAHYPNGVLAWAGGALLAAAVIPSQPALWLGFGLIALWTGQELLAFDAAGHAVFLPVWAVAAAIAVVRRWWRALVPGVLVFGWWYAAAGLRVTFDVLELEPLVGFSVLMVLPLLLWAGGDAVPRVGHALGALGVVGVLACGWGVILADTYNVDAPELRAQVPVLWGAVAAGLLAAGAGGVFAAWRGLPWKARTAWGAAMTLLAPLWLLLTSAFGVQVAGWTGNGAYLAAIVALALIGGREGDTFTRRLAYLAFAMHIGMLYTMGAVSLLSLFLFFTVAGAALLVSALRMERRT